MQCNWNHQWDFVENHQYTIYRHRPDAQVKGDFYTWHTDASDREQSNGRIRKLSSTIQLSNPDDYEGGHFQWIEPVGIFDKLKATPHISIDVDKHIILFTVQCKRRRFFYNISFFCASPSDTNNERYKSIVSKLVSR